MVRLGPIYSATDRNVKLYPGGGVAESRNWLCAFAFSVVFSCEGLKGRCTPNPAPQKIFNVSLVISSCRAGTIKLDEVPLVLEYWSTQWAVISMVWRMLSCQTRALFFSLNEDWV